MSGHTPGPWLVGYGDGISGSRAAPSCFFDETAVECIPIRTGQNAVAYVAWLGPKQDHKANADARLIAAAPDLLHACRLIIENAPLAADWLERNDVGAYKQVQAAIAKATQS